MNKQERIKAGFVGKRKFIDPTTGEEFLIDFEDENTTIFSSEERKLMKKGRKDLSEFTEEKD